jgi:hypothetical protein
LGPTINIKNVKDLNQLVNKRFDFTALSKSLEYNVKLYKSTFEKFKDAAIDNNIDLFICYAIINDACLDVAHTLKKPAVGLLSFLNCNYIYIFFLKNIKIKNKKLN